MHTGVANLPLHGGRAPAWLFRRMRLLAREIARIVVENEGPIGLLRRLSDPFWFQAFGCLLGFDWHSSGLTTTTCGALKEGLDDLGGDLHLFAAGGKGRRSRQTPREIEAAGAQLASGVEAGDLVESSRLAAKVDSAAVQDGYQIYHHAFFFTRDGDWAVVQQGMNERQRYARRYHWLSESITDPVEEPHAAVCCDRRARTLNLVARSSRANRDALRAMACEPPSRWLSELARLRTLSLPARHAVALRDIHPHRLERTLLSTYLRAPHDFRQLLLTPGLGARSLRALSFTAEIIFGAAPSFEDPARFSFAHGGKDGHPYPVDRQSFDHTIDFLSHALGKATIDRSERARALRRLLAWSRTASSRRSTPRPARPSSGPESCAGAGAGGQLELL